MRINLQREAGHHKARFQDEDSKKIITERDLSLFYESQKAKQALTALKSKSIKNLTVREACNVRNFLITSLLIENIARPAALYRLTCQDVQRAKEKLEFTEFGNGMYTMPAFYDKNVQKSGMPNYLVISEPLMGYLTRYVNVFRGILASRGREELNDLFLLEQGTRMDSDALSKGFR